MTNEEELIERAHRVAEQLTRLTLPQEMIDAGYRFVFDTTPLPVLKEREDGT